MGILKGTISLTRFNVVSRPEEPDFELASFVAIPPGSERRESVGFVPFQLEAPYRLGAARFAFRVRIDTVKPDPTAVRERLDQLEKTELETSGNTFVGSKKRRELKNLAEEELLVQTPPKAKIIEGVIEGNTVYVATTADAHLGRVLIELHKIGIVAEHKTPWLDAGEPELMSDLVSTRGQEESVRGCRFLRSLLGDNEVLFEPENGHVSLQTHRARITLRDEIMVDLHAYVEKDAELLSARLLYESCRFNLDALRFRISGLSVETGHHDHWSNLLDERLERIDEVWSMLDRKYKALG